MKRPLTMALLMAFCALAAPAGADEDQTYTGALSPAEQQFIQSVQHDLMARFPHAADAEKAGYVRYTAPDDTGAISYANTQWWNSDQTHPSQLWYDANGDLMGADFAVPRPNNEPRPQLWGVNPGRWYEFNGHVHYVIKMPDGKLVYGPQEWVWNNTFTSAGGNVSKPSADTLVKIGRAPSTDYIPTIFEFPTQWDLIVWLKPHAAGTFHW